MFYRHFVRILNFSKDKYRIQWYDSYYMGPKTKQNIRDFNSTTRWRRRKIMIRGFQLGQVYQLASKGYCLTRGIFLEVSLGIPTPTYTSIFIDAINGNLVNSLLGITIEIQMKGEYVVFVRFPNRFCPILCRITVLIQLKPIFYSFQMLKVRRHGLVFNLMVDNRPHHNFFKS